MPIFYNFHILLATFYTIFGTNILIQCPVPVPVCCMFFVSQNIHTKRSPNAIKKPTRLFFWNIYDFWEEESTRNDARGGQKPRRRAPLGRGWQACDQSRRRLGPFFHGKKANIQKKIALKFQPNKSYGSPGI